MLYFAEFKIQHTYFGEFLRSQRTETLEELIVVLTKHYNPLPSEVMQHFCFNTRMRKEGESVSDYLRHLAKLVILETPLKRCFETDTCVALLMEKTQKKLRQH